MTVLGRDVKEKTSISLTPLGGIWLIYKQGPRGREGSEGECLQISHIPTVGVIIDLFPAARCSFGKPAAIVDSV